MNYFYEEFLGTAYLTHLKFIEEMWGVFDLKSKPCPIEVSLSEIKGEDFEGLFLGKGIIIKHPEFQDGEEFRKDALYHACFISAHESGHYLHLMMDPEKWKRFSSIFDRASNDWKEFVAELSAIIMSDHFPDMLVPIMKSQRPIYAVAREVYTTLTHKKREDALPELLRSVARSSPAHLESLIDMYVGKGFYKTISERYKNQD